MIIIIIILDGDDDERTGDWDLCSYERRKEVKKMLLTLMMEKVEEKR